MLANIVGKQCNNFVCDAVSDDEACGFLKKKKNYACLRAYISTSKPEIFFFFFF